MEQSSLLSGDRYLASNRFNVRSGGMQTFEKRWADRKSLLETREGFRFFTLLKRTPAFGIQYDSDFGNYMSFTYWDEKKHYDAWRTSKDFKSAHGGGGLFDFIKMITGALFVVNGPPKPAFFDALLMKSADHSATLHKTYHVNTPVEYDSVTNLIKPNLFVAQNRFTVIPGKEREFETQWASRSSYLENVPGFLSFALLRRSDKVDDGFNYISTSLWADQQAFADWRNSESFTAAHARAHHQHEASKPVLYFQSPKLAFYEGKMTICSERGI